MSFIQGKVTAETVQPIRYRSKEKGRIRQNMHRDLHSSITPNCARLLCPPALVMRLGGCRVKRLASHGASVTGHSGTGVIAGTASVLQRQLRGRMDRRPSSIPHTPGLRVFCFHDTTIAPQRELTEEIRYTTSTPTIHSHSHSHSHTDPDPPASPLSPLPSPPPAEHSLAFAAFPLYTVHRTARCRDSSTPISYHQRRPTPPPLPLLSAPLPIHRLWRPRHRP